MFSIVKLVLVTQRCFHVPPWPVGEVNAGVIRRTETLLTTRFHGRVSCHSAPNGGLVRTLRTMVRGPSTSFSAENSATARNIRTRNICKEVS